MAHRQHGVYGAAGPDPRGRRGPVRGAPGANGGPPARPPIIAGRRGAASWSFTGPGPDGTILTTRGCDIYEFRGGKIARRDAFRKVYQPDTQD